MVRTLVVTARAATLGADPEVVWKDLSTTATLSYDGQPAGDQRHDPRPQGHPAERRLRDRALRRQAVPDGPGRVRRPRAPEQRDTRTTTPRSSTPVVNDPDFVGLDLQPLPGDELRPAVPAGHRALGGHRHGHLLRLRARLRLHDARSDRSDGRRLPRRTTAGEAPGVIGSPAFDTRIQDGWYQLPGTTEYYGGDFPAFTVADRSPSTRPAGRWARPSSTPPRSPTRRSTTTTFDSDKDGVVDFFMLVFVGCGGNGASQLAGRLPVLRQHAAVRQHLAALVQPGGRSTATRRPGSAATSATTS